MTQFRYTAERASRLHGEFMLTKVEFFAITRLIPLVALPTSKRADAFFCACVCESDVEIADYMVHAIRTVVQIKAEEVAQ